jgi:hypothetical protein
MHGVLAGLQNALVGGRKGLLLAVGVAALTATTVFAQPGGGGGRGGGGGGMRGMMGDFFSSPVATREIDIFAEIAGLSTEQKEDAKALLEGTQAEFRTKSDKIQKEMDKVREKFQESRDPAVWTEMRESMQTFRKEREAIEEQFFADFKMILTNEQAERWPRIERAHRRARTLSRGMISGERADLIQIMNSSKFAAEVQAEVLPVLAEYEEALDRELIARNKAYDEAAEAFGNFNPGGGGGGGMERMQEIFTKGREASIRVREVNKKYARQIGDVLPETDRPAFEEAVKRASYPEVYRTTTASRELAAAEQFNDLDDTQKQGISALKETYQRSLNSVNDKLAAEITKREESFDPRQMMRGRGGAGGGGGGRGGQGGGDDATGELRRERRTLDESTAASLRKILSEEQVKRLPEDEDDDGGERRGGDRGGQRRGGTNQQI